MHWYAGKVIYPDFTWGLMESPCLGPFQILSYVSLHWLVLICIPYNETVIIKCSTFLSSLNHPSKLWNLRGLWESMNLWPIGQKWGWSGDPWTCSCHLSRVVLLENVSLTCGGYANSGWLLPELHCGIAHIFVHSGKISVLDTCAHQILTLIYWENCNDSLLPVLPIGANRGSSAWHQKHAIKCRRNNVIPLMSK